MLAKKSYYDEPLKVTMTNKTAWSHLPNAAHIERLLASVKAHPEQWTTATDASWNTALDLAWHASYDAAWDAAYDATCTVVARASARYAAWGAIAALVVYDDCSQYLSMTSDQLRVWAILSEKPAAILLLPAVIAFEKISELK